VNHLQVLSVAQTGEHILLLVSLQLIAIITAARAGGWLFSKCGQPQVVGEIMTGLLLGPTCIGRVIPDSLEFMFPPETESVLYILGQLGLIFLMFMIGLEFDFRSLRSTGSTAAGIAVSGIVLPFVLGAAVAWSIHKTVAPQQSQAGFVLFIATALSITASPILGRIMKEFQLTRTAVGVLTISAAAIDDAMGWILLAAVSAGVHGAFRLTPVVAMLAMTVLYIAVIIFVVRPVIISWARHVLQVHHGEFPLIPLSVVIVAVLLSAVATNTIGIFSIFGPFVLGAALSDQSEFQRAMRERIEEFITAFFLPVFFTYTGLRTDMGLLDTPTLWLICSLLVAAAVFGKVVGCALAARWGRLPWRDCLVVGIMMNTRALMGLIAINIGRDLGVIPDTVFSMMVLMAIVTTVITAPILKRLLKTPSPAVS
jgi:Kef-type K+ transport system membrane component KefB